MPDLLGYSFLKSPVPEMICKVLILVLAFNPERFKASLREHPYLLFFSFFFSFFITWSALIYFPSTIISVSPYLIFFLGMCLFCIFSF